MWLRHICEWFFNETKFRDRRIAQNLTQEPLHFRKGMILVSSTYRPIPQTTDKSNVFVKVFLQTSDSVSPRRWADCPSICGDDARRPGGGPGQATGVCLPHHLLRSCDSPSTRGVYAAIASFLMFSMLQFRDGPFIRPHPSFWRIVLGINLLYEMALVFLLFQDLGTARVMMTYIDPNLGVPLPEKSYAEDCSLTPQTIWVCPFFLLSDHQLKDV